MKNSNCQYFVHRLLDRLGHYDSLLANAYSFLYQGEDYNVIANSPYPILEKLEMFDRYIYLGALLDDSNIPD